MDFVNEVKSAELGQTNIFSVGQAGFIIKSKSGQLLAIDLYLSNCVEKVENSNAFKRLLPQILTPDGLEFDCLICTHFHRDHFDIESVPSMMINSDAKLYCAVDCKDDVINRGIDLDRTRFVKPGEKYNCGDFTLYFINCDHGTGAPLAVGVIIEVDDQRIVEIGDTCLRLDRKDEYLSQGKIDVLIAPINGAYGNLNEFECAELSNILKPRITIPCHYGMFAGHGGNVGIFYKVMQEKYPNNDFIVMCQGEKISL